MHLITRGRLFQASGTATKNERRMMPVKKIFGKLFKANDVLQRTSRVHIVVFNRWRRNISTWLCISLTWSFVATLQKQHYEQASASTNSAAAMSNCTVMSTNTTGKYIISWIALHCYGKFPCHLVETAKQKLYYHYCNKRYWRLKLIFFWRNFNILN